MSEHFRTPSHLPLLPIALRMAAHRITALLAVVCAVLGGAALITGTGVLAESGLRSQLPPGRLGGADIVVAADQEYHPDGDLPLALPERARVPSSLTGRLSDLPGVTAVVGDLGFPAALVDARGGAVPTADDPAAAGHGWSSTQLLARPRVTGRAPAGADEIAVPAATGLRTGDRVQVVAGGRPAVRYRVAALVDAPGAGLYFADATAVRLADHDGAHRYDLIGLRTAPGAVERVADAVRDRVAGAGLTVRTGADIGETVAPGVGTARSLLVLLAGSLGGIVLLITGFVTAGALGVTIAGQRRELALMRAVGATPRQIRRLAAAQSSVVAAVALAPGVALGYLLAGRFHEMLADRGVLPPELPLTVSPLPALAALLLLALTVQIAARGAAWRTSRMPATEAVAESRSEPRTSSKGRTLTGVLLIAAACALSVTPLLTRTVIGASATSIAGIVAAIGLALCGPALVRTAGTAAARRLRPTAPAPTWLALANVRAYALRVAAVVSPLAMAVVFVLTYTLAQTTVLAATAQDTRTGTLAQYRLSAPALGGLPTGTRDAVRKLPGVRFAAPVGSTTVVWPYEMFGEPDVESVPALIATPDAAGVLDPGVREGALAGLTGATVAVSREVAGARDAGLGERIHLVLGDGTRTQARVAAVYDRGLGFGSLIVSGDLMAGHTTSGLTQSLLVRTDGTATAAHALAELTASRQGLTLENTFGTASGGKQETPPEVWINLATIVVLLGYLLLSIANKLVAATAQRRTEIAALRLVGTTPRQIRSMMRREAAVIAAAALACGLLLSALPLALLGQGFLDRPWPAGPAWLLPAVAVTIVTTAFLTIELPTRQALRTAPADAIRAT
ncbi:FtsX-like permease family protein [Streptomyces caniscabiei]|uniref:FtsX-like permease family protein n=1 Tax=Streptomyces caniscabiei TaxID=2746961 RepID=A0A927L5C4_9ACTN|nr:ABC transporter permease [Streptomyces caniscabiei]MBD9724254.1 FtsX-like permease family protein [Streptomyces caniscabiei]MDX3513242.1 FtsX-like permease family protein [Streptomyces caniscabiei]MDX3718743.1 FtsX-like permease family protein [Streptomyces caniscabiei]WEO21866.1 FtsX-like permease family protein [Streptomyces caniscabiei]